MNVIVLGGLGQVGSAFCSLLEEKRHHVYIIDKAEDLEPTRRIKYDFLHVTIPYTDNFIPTVKKLLTKYDPEFVVIHSTVPVGTTRRIGSYAAHSPVRGNHPNLKDGLLRFVTYVGAHKVETRLAVGNHLKGLGMNVTCWEKAEDSELMKGLCLSRYMSDLAFYETAFKTCKRFGVAPIRLVEWTNTYNDGYAGTRHKRAELSFPMGHVGGHCVVPVSRMMAHQTGYRHFKDNLAVFRL